MNIDLEDLDLTPAAAPAAPSGASLPQQRLILDLIAERDLEGTPYQDWKPDFNSATCTPKAVRQVIDYLKARPRKPYLQDAVALLKGTAPGCYAVYIDGEVRLVPNGRYAVQEDGVLKFFKVNTPTEGRWKGFTFLDVQASDDLHAIRNRERKAAVLATIAQDVQGAMLAYGQQIGQCGHCGRTLTNEESRERGIGPICAERLGW